MFERDEYFVSCPYETFVAGESLQVPNGPRTPSGPIKDTSSYQQVRAHLVRHILHDVLPSPHSIAKVLDN